MPVLNRFNIAILLALFTTLGVKIATKIGLENPSKEKIAHAMIPFMEQQGFQSAGVVSLSGVFAGFFQRDNCTLYLAPVIPQGSNAATILHIVTVDQDVGFVADGVYTPSKQPSIAPTISYFLNKALAYFNLGGVYPTVLAIISTKACDIGSVNWETVPDLPYDEIKFTF